jgi:hypothetical protein
VSVQVRQLGVEKRKVISTIFSLGVSQTARKQISSVVNQFSNVSFWVQFIQVNNKCVQTEEITRTVEVPIERTSASHRLLNIKSQILSRKTFTVYLERALSAREKTSIYSKCCHKDSRKWFSWHLGSLNCLVIVAVPHTFTMITCRMTLYGASLILGLMLCHRMRMPSSNNWTAARWLSRRWKRSTSMIWPELMFTRMIILRAWWKVSQCTYGMSDYFVSLRSIQPLAVSQNIITFFLIMTT